MSKKAKGNLLLLLTAFIWGMAFAFQKEGATNLGPYTFGASRCLLAAISVGIVAFILNRGKKHEKEYWKNTIIGGLFCGLFLTLATNLQQVGLVLTSAGKGAFITALYMLLIPLILFVTGKGKIDGKTWVCVGLGVLGMYLLCMSGSLTMNFGDVLIIACAFAFALQMLFASKYSKLGDPITMSAIQFFVNFVVTGVMAFLFEDPIITPSMFFGIEIVYCGIFSGGIGYTLQLVAEKDTDPTICGLILSLESVFGAVGGALLLHERMSGKEYLGCLIMFIAIILVQIDVPGKKKNKSK